ncbi:hypothetical protein [Streptomyces sp. GC420]|uniref:hypothetical protein n=1 Tax=Streptomyces sp. GC420 TaxID=2697568 RepID=UPI001414FBBA|nr:hypothetical protein [Streptomyces sp. GC420]NBM17270.1 hypothetical protein [Streptomyces sp. GC420]
MSAGPEDGAAYSAAAPTSVRPWHTLASLGITESDLTTGHHRPVPVHRFLGRLHPTGARFLRSQAPDHTPAPATAPTAAAE